MTHDYFKDYREAYDDWHGNTEIEAMRDVIEIKQKQLAELEAPYKDRMRKAEEGIHVITLDQQRTVFLHGIEATYVKPRKSTSWKNVAMHFKPSNELIEEHSKVGSPSVRIKVHEGIELEEEA